MINSDFFISTLFDMVSPIELFHIRSGPILNEVIWSEHHCNTYIDLKIKYEQIGTSDHNLFLNLNYHKYDHVSDWMEHSDSIIVDKIRLCITSDEWITDKAGLDTAKAGLDTAKAGLDTDKAGLDTAKAGLDTAKAGLDH